MTVIDALDAGACYDGVVKFVAKYGVIAGDPHNFPEEFVIGYGVYGYMPRGN